MAGSSPSKPRASDDDAIGNAEGRKPNAKKKQQQQQQPQGGRDKKASVVAVSFLQPRVAVALGVPQFWHPFLFACRLLSITPALWWGLRCALRFLITDLLKGNGLGPLPTTGDSCGLDQGSRRLPLTETALSIIWCGASAYLAFVFTDSLMSRWLLNYTPQATIVRLFTLCCIFTYISSRLIFLLGGDQSPSLLLPAWIAIATTLTVCYHVSQRKINIRKETSASISVFSIASFISMVALLVDMHVRGQVDYPHIPLIALLRRAAELGGRVVVTLLGVHSDRDSL